jgi:uncharacterized phage protein gp47/JayE
MPFDRPTLAELADRAVSDINTRLPGADASLRRSNLNVLALTHAGAVHGLYGYLDWIVRQVIYDTAESEYLERWSSIWGIYRLPAAYATGSVTLAGASGSVVPAGTVLTRADGAEFSTDDEVTFSGTTATASVTALEAGQDGNTAAAAKLTITTPVAGVEASATVDSNGLTQGADVETDAALRARLLSRIRQPPHGGASHDYLAWALEVPGVTRAWVYPQELGAGTVTVRFVRDNDAAIFPDAGELAAVQAYIDERRPVTAQVTVTAPIAAPLDFTFTSISPSTAAVKAAVEAELADLISRESEPGGTLYLSHIRAAISAAVGENNYMMTAPSADVANSTGYMTTLGTVTWP